MTLQLDDILMRRLYQPIADFVMDRFLRSCFWLAAQSTLASLASFVLSLVLGALWHAHHPEAATHEPLWAAALLAPLGVGLLAWIAWAARVRHHEAVEAEARWLRTGDLPPWHHSAAAAAGRVIWLVAVTLFVADDALQGVRFDYWLWDLGMVLWWAERCFMACTPRPPRRRRRLVEQT